MEMISSLENVSGLGESLFIFHLCSVHASSDVPLPYILVGTVHGMASSPNHVNKASTKYFCIEHEYLKVIICSANCSDHARDCRDLWKCKSHGRQVPTNVPTTVHSSDLLLWLKQYNVYSFSQ